MIDRIQKIIEEEGMSQGRFANEIGIIDSRLSHYLSGRSKVSLELVTKILERFRGINSDWLLFGRGEMYKSAEAKASSREPDLFSSSLQVQEQPINANEAEKSDYPRAERDFSEPEPFKHEENTVTYDNQYTVNQNVEPLKPVQKERAAIEKIIVMYSD